MSDNTQDTQKKCSEDIENCSIETFQNLGELYVEAEAADISKFSDQEKKAYDRRINHLYNIFIAKESEIYSIPADSIKDDVIKLRKSMEDLRKSLENLKNITTAMTAISSIIRIITSILSFSKLSSLTEFGAAPHMMAGRSVSMAEVPFTSFTAAGSEFRTNNDICIQQLIEERDFLRKVITNLTLCEKS